MTGFGGLPIEGWFQQQSSETFPTGFEYQKNYSAMSANLASLHAEVTPTANVIDGGYLTDHGPGHIAKLLSRITELLKATPNPITPYECYLLLAAAQFHDVGNIFGRDRHEEKCREIMSDNSATLPPDTVERRKIFEIAQAHGGHEKDKLPALAKTEHIRGQPVRMQALAAILKFADELAEDSERGARYSAKSALLPPESAIFHAYALSLVDVHLDGDAGIIAMRFDLKKSEALKAFPKKDKHGAIIDTYLIDEILSRTLKTHYERVYCSRFMRPLVDVVGVSVHIDVTDDSGYSILRQITFRLQERGYPNFDATDIYGLCPELAEWDGNGRFDGSHLARKLGGQHAV